MAKTEKTVGLFRALQQDWLNKTAELVIQGYNDADIKEKLEEYLSYEIESPINRGKSRALLMNIWANPEYTSGIVHSKAIEAFKSDRSDKMALGWSLFVLAHPIFADACGFIGKISKVQDTFSSSWLTSKICEMRGERLTLKRSVSGVLDTMKCLGAIEQIKTGLYRTKRYPVKDEKTIVVMLMSILALGTSAYYEIPDLPQAPHFFPFEFDVTTEFLHNCPDFTLENFGGKIVLSATGIR